ncbi:unknown [Mycoplasma sp. CAG:956]|nr:unknown [Mycoplasma sp. CAG:956]
MYLLDFWEQNLPEQLGEFFNKVKTFIVDTGMTIYDNMVSIMGETPAKMTIIAGAVIIVLTVLLKIINR